MIDLIEKYFDHPDIAIYRNNDMLQINQYDVSKALVSLAMEQSLVQVGGSIVLDVVSDKIFEKYQCHIPDCYEHPERLNSVLVNMPISMHHTIVRLIRNQLDEFSYKKEIQYFLEKLNHGMNLSLNTIT
ncbi:hypothetical protein DYY66_2734 [Candidatus Nitrosotalea sp. FS]|uniref:hypothetical protein n=1 Tax=Candidatus Nitrosotalea sp. FS TaxID=2341021 RepID=UPI00140E8984|nr:hypothetical protein [Candidatus Nitrosotalea sp. FS]NHH98472.1 hypothetical protein [Candidatus Nitrosotalea sp. FS]